MAEPPLSPENLLKLTQTRVRAQTAAAANGVGGLSVGDKAELMGGFEKLINLALSGSSKMGGREGLLDKFNSLIERYTKTVKEEMTVMFNKIFKNQEQMLEKSDEPVEIDEEQYKELHEKSLKDTFNSKIMKNLAVERESQLKKFLKSNFITSVFQNKIFKKLMGGIKAAISGFSENLNKFVSVVSKFIVQTGKVLVSIAKATKIIIFRLAMMMWTVVTTVISAAFSVISFLLFTVVPMLFSIIGFLLFTVLPAIISGIIAIITALIPIAIAVGAILLKVLIVVAIIFLIVFVIWKIWKWLEKTFPETIEKVKNFFKGLWEGAKKLWDGFIEFTKMSWEWLKTAATAAWDAAGVAWNWLEENIGQLVSWVGEMFTQTWTWLESVPYVGEVFKWIRETFFDLAKNLHNLFFGEGPFIERLVNFFLDTKLFRDLAKLGDWILNKLQSAWNTLYGWVETAIKWWGEVFKKGWDWMVNNIKKLIGLVEKVIGFLGGGLKKIGKGVKQGMEAAGAAVKNTGKFFKNLVSFGDGGIVYDKVFSVIGETGETEAVIPLDNRGIQFLAQALAESNVFGMYTDEAIVNKVYNSDMFIQLSQSVIQSLKNTNDVKNALSELYKFVSGNDFDYSSLSYEMSETDINRLFTQGGIVNNTADDTPDMVVPLNNSGAEFVKAVLADEMFIGTNETNDKISGVDNRLAKIEKMLKSGRNAVGTPISSNSSNNTINYVDMVAKGIIE